MGGINLTEEDLPRSAIKVLQPDEVRPKQFAEKARAHHFQAGRKMD
jgi:hypothetical protein